MHQNRKEVLMSKNLKTAGVIILMICLAISLYFNRESYIHSGSSDMYKEEYEKQKAEFFKKATADSLKYVAELEKIAASRDSVQNHLTKEKEDLQKTINYYAKQIYAPQVAPIAVVDSQYDSVLIAIRNRYNRPPVSR